MKHLSFEKQIQLLKLEYEHEKQEYEKATQIIGIGRKVKRGDCWYPISVGQGRYNSLDLFVVDITRTADFDIEHNFEYGRTVSFFTEDGSGQLHHLPFRAQVSYAEEDRMVVVLPNESALAQLQGSGRLGVQLFFDETTYRLMFDALNKIMFAREGRMWELREIFHGSRPMAEPLKIPHIRLPWLNGHQEMAVNRVVACKDVAIVHGPPGTGKTTTLVEAVIEVLKREAQVIVCAQSNTAVDWISQRLTERDVSVLRIGNPSRVTDDMLACTYERRFESHPDYPTLWAIRRDMRQLYSTPRGRRGRDFHQKISRLRDRVDEIELRIRTALFDQCRVIACTLAGAANPLLQGQHWHSLFIDEAAQAMEAACWIAIQKADRVILAGDHQQLPPTVKDPVAQREGLGTTLMEQIAANKPQCVTMLTMQYRMNEELMRFSSEWFYDGQLEAAPSVRHRSLIDELDSPLVWINTDERLAEGEGGEELDYRERFVGSNYGRINKAEAQLTLSTLQQYAARIGHRRIRDEHIDFGIISPYRAQVQYLRKIIHSSPELKDIRRAVTINTIDSFQGQERDVIIISLVRANDHGQIGFLSDLRRMNVAMTRARMKLIIIGNAQTLCRHKFYRELYHRCTEA